MRRESIGPPYSKKMTQENDPSPYMLLLALWLESGVSVTLLATHKFFNISSKAEIV